MSVLFESWHECEGMWKRSSLYLSAISKEKTKRRGVRVWKTKVELEERFGKAGAEAIIHRKMQDEDLKSKEIREHPEAPGCLELQQFLVLDSEKTIEEEEEVISRLYKAADGPDSESYSGSDSGSGSSDKSDSNSSEDESEEKSKGKKKGKKGKKDKKPKKKPTKTKATKDAKKKKKKTTEKKKKGADKSKKEKKTTKTKKESSDSVDPEAEEKEKKKDLLKRGKKAKFKA